MHVQNWEIDGDSRVQDIFLWALREASVDHVLLISRLADPKAARSRAMAAVGDITKDLLAGRMVDSFRASAWPGTELFGHCAFVYIARFDEDCAKRMSAIEPRLAGWVHTASPPRPEDICLFRHGDALPAFYSVTHERRAWCIAPTKPGFAPGAVSSICQRADLSIPDAQYFCDINERSL